MLTILCLLIGQSETHLATIGGWKFYKVQVQGQMTSPSQNVKQTCESKGYVNTCVGDSGCYYSGSGCTITSLLGCGNPMKDISTRICNGNIPRDCFCLRGVYAYMDKFSGNACGVDRSTGSWCDYGTNKHNVYALCAKK